MTTPALSWEFLAKFKPPHPERASTEPKKALIAAPNASLIGSAVPQSFEQLAGWLAKWDALLRADLLLLEAEQRLWNERLAELGGDPATLDFSTFRPLRLSREEDWSAWLAHLVETSKTGRLAANLFEGGQSSLVRREVPLASGARRADLLLQWGDKATHLEVKVGDDAFEKTFETAGHVEREYPTRTWRHLVLLLPRQVPAWAEIAGERTTVGVVTWEEVAVGLRGELWNRTEPVSWRVWALTFCAAIEQTLLGMPKISSENGARPDSATAANRARRLPILQRARPPEKSI